MKRTLLLFSIISGGFAASAQCTPDPSITTGISPDTAANLSVSYVGQSYSEVFTFVVPTDTIVSPYGNVPIHHITLTSITGQPSNYDYGCNPSNCEFAGGTSGCVNFYSTSNPTSNQVGTYPLVINAMGYVTVWGAAIQNPGGASTYDGYYLVIAEQGLLSVEHASVGDMKSLIAYPNPTNGNTTIEFAMGYNSDVTFTLTNLLGNVVNAQKISTTKGLNTIKLDASTLANGIYLYTITDGVNTISKKLTVNK